MIRYVLEYAGKNVFVDNRSFKNKAYAKRKLEELEEVYHTCIDLKAVEVESVEEYQVAQIKILREALELIKLDQKYNYGKGSYELSHASEIARQALAEIDKVKEFEDE